MVIVHLNISSPLCPNQKVPDFVAGVKTVAGRIGSGMVLLKEGIFVIVCGRPPWCQEEVFSAFNKERRLQMRVGPGTEDSRLAAGWRGEDGVLPPSENPWKAQLGCIRVGGPRHCGRLRLKTLDGVEAIFSCPGWSPPGL